MIRSARQPFAILIAAVLLLRQPAFGQETDARALLQEAQRLVSAYHAGQPPSGNVLRVVYFFPNDRQPQPSDAARLDRILSDVSDFYAQGFQRFGLKAKGLPLERNGGKLVIHPVRGQLPTSQYHFDSGKQTALEIRESLAGELNLDREHVIVFYALATQAPDGHYAFDAPYYGGGSHRNGLSHAADLELLDPALLTQAQRTISYSSHYHPHVSESLAKFNTKYLGGTAHELGHSLGLPHDSGGELDQTSGASLMGNGNLTYRQDAWGGGVPAYLSCATALHLLSHPLITGSDRGRWEDAFGGFESLNVATQGEQVIIQGAVAGAVPPYAVIAYSWPTSDSTDHGARTAPTLPKNGRFKVAFNRVRPGSYNLRVEALHLNGAITTQLLRFDVDANQGSGPSNSAANSLIEKAEQAVMLKHPDVQKLLSDKAFSASSSPEIRSKVRVLREVLKPVPPRKLAAVRDNRAFLSDVSWEDATVGWGQLARNHYWFDEKIHNGVFLMLGGKFYEKGLYAHSPSRFVFDLNRKWKSFSAEIGLRDGARSQGSAIFTVRGDGKELYRSTTLRAGQQETVKLDIGQVKELELLTEGGEKNNFNSWAI